MNQRKIILVKNADAEVTRYLEHFIPLLGSYEVRRASSDLELWATINAVEPALLILGLPGLKGDQGKLLSQIREKHPKIRLLLLAESPIEESLLKNAGVPEVLTKPIDLTDLSQKIKSLLPREEGSQQKEEYARLLVADDERGINQLAMSLLKPLGIEVHSASDGEEALRVFKENRCNLALIDLRMPKLRGTKLIKLLEASDDPPPPKAILVMCAALGDNLEELRRLGHPILPKPMDLEVLEENVLAACKKYGLALHKEKIEELH